MANALNGLGRMSKGRLLKISAQAANSHTKPAVLLATLCMISACAERVYAPTEAVAAARYTSNEAPYVALLTMATNSRDQGAHSALLVNGSQVALYDPAGTYAHPSTPERGDVFYGITPVMEEAYKRYHARDSHYVLEQKLPISRAKADAIIARMEAQGPSPKVFCAVNVAEVLRDFEEFSHVPRSFFPGALRDGFGKTPGLLLSETREDDSGKSIRLRVGDEEF